MNTCKCGKQISHHKTMCIACMWKEAQKRAGGGMKIKPKQTRICGWCGKEFTVNVYNKTYCSNKCANAFRNSQTETRVCIVCGERFETLSRNTAVRCMDCRSKKPEKKKCTFTPTNDNTPDGPNELDMWMGDRGLVPVRVETGRQKAKATVKIRPEKLRKPLLEPTKQWTGETPEERFWRSAAEAMQKYRMKAPAERKRRDTCPKGRYTETEDAIILNMRKSGVKIAQIAAATGRSVPAIKQRLGWLARNATSSKDASSGEACVPSTGA